MNDSITAAGMTEPERTTLLITYLLHAVAVVNGLTAVIGVVINHLKIDAVGSLAKSHHRWLIHTFWWTLLWTVLATILTVAGIGMLIYLVVAVWWLYRIARGLLNFVDHKPMPA
jgi:uncharacterized membrane protein